MSHGIDFPVLLPLLVLFNPFNTVSHAQFIEFMHHTGKAVTSQDRPTLGCLGQATIRI